MSLGWPAKGRSSLRSTFMKLDHLFVGTNDVVAAADVMSSCGFVEGSSNQHPGQGTANRRYFFSNAMVELLYVDDGVDSGHPQNHLLNLEARCQASLDDRSISKLGVCFRPSHTRDRDPVFGCIKYTPHYLPPQLHIDIDRERRAGEPLWFHLPFASDELVAERNALEPQRHPSGVSRLSQLYVTTSADSLSHSAETINRETEVDVEIGATSLMTIDFDDRAQGQVFDLRPLLPLILRT